MARAKQPRTGKAGGRRWRSWRNLLYALLAFSLFQLLGQGEITWPTTVAGKVGDSLRDYANRPGASWREAADKLEELGAAREGHPVPEFGISGRVVRVADGDTISVLDRNNTQYKIRLHGIDTPERDQRYGKAAWDALSDMVDGKAVGVVVLGKDSYGRTDGIVYLGETNINLAMVTAGHAWWYRYYAPDEHLLEAAEAAARRERLGLWATPDPIPPWDWRRQQKYGKP
ncbi:MAG: thermonuclease family protein [Halioglobus sp.]|nr:thermonuclease family protein [Halioglobus sp.]